MKINRELAREREDRAWEMRQRGWTQAAIGKELGISQVGAGKALRRAEARVLKRMSDRIEGIKATQHAQLEHIVMESLQAWERSKSDVKTTKVTKDGDGGKAERTTKTTPGTPSFLAEARQALADIRRLWGVGTGDDEELSAEERYNVWADKRREDAKQKQDDGLPSEVQRLRESYTTFGGDDGEFLRLCGEAETMGSLGSTAHMIELRRLTGPTFRAALRGANR